MSTTQTPQGAATSPTPPAAPPTKLDATKARIEKIGAVATVLGGIGAVLVAGIGTASGYVQSGYDWLTSASSTTSQVTAIEERVKAIETFKATVEADRAEAAKTARTLDDAVRELARQGADVASLRDLQRQVEMKLERLDGILEVLRERRR